MARFTLELNLNPSGTSIDVLLRRANLISPNSLSQQHLLQTHISIHLHTTNSDMTPHTPPLPDLHPHNVCRAPCQGYLYHLQMAAHSASTAVRVAWATILGGSNVQLFYQIFWYTSTKKIQNFKDIFVDTYELPCACGHSLTLNLFSLCSLKTRKSLLSRLGLEVIPLGVYLLEPRSSSCGPTKGTPPPRTTLRTIWG